MDRGEKFGEISLKARKAIALLGQDFIFEGCTILVHGFSRVVLEVLKLAAENGKLFRVLCTGSKCLSFVISFPTLWLLEYAFFIAIV